MKAYHYLDVLPKTVIRIVANRRPAISTRPLSGVWVGQEYWENTWAGGYDLTLEEIKDMVYLGCTVISEE